eukprot:g62104.t1
MELVWSCGVLGIRPLKILFWSILSAVCHIIPLGWRWLACHSLGGAGHMLGECGVCGKDNWSNGNKREVLGCSACELMMCIFCYWNHPCDGRDRLQGFGKYWVPTVVPADEPQDDA